MKINTKSIYFSVLFLISSSIFYQNCAGFWSPASIRSGAWQDAVAPQIADYPNGDAWAIWYRFDNELPRIQVSRYTALTSMWTPISNVQTLSAADKAAIDPQIAIDPLGNAIAVWIISDPTFRNKQVQTARYNATFDKWTSVPELIILSEAEAFFPQIAMDNNGNGIAVWQIIDDSGTWTVQAARYEIAFNDWIRDGSGNPLVIDIATGTSDDPFWPTVQIGMDATGNAIMVWQEKDGAVYRINSTIYDKSPWQTWNPTVLQEYLSSSGVNSFWPQIYMNKKGSATVVWQQIAGAIETIQTTRYEGTIQDWIRDGGTNPLIINLESFTASTPTFVWTDVAMDEKGNTIIVWYNTNFQIQATRYNSADDTWSGWVPFVQTISAPGNFTVLPKIDMDPKGNAVVAWLLFDGNGNFRIQVSCYNEKTNLWTPTDQLAIISPEGNDAFQQQVIVDDNGDSIIIWVQSDGVNLRVYESHCEKTPRASNLETSQKKLRFPRCFYLINTITWQTFNPTIYRYKFYEDAELKKLIGQVVVTNKEFCLCNNNLNNTCKKLSVSEVFVVAEDLNGNMSKPIRIDFQ